MSSAGYWSTGLNVVGLGTFLDMIGHGQSVQIISTVVKVLQAASWPGFPTEVF